MSAARADRYRAGRKAYNLVDFEPTADAGKDAQLVMRLPEAWMQFLDDEVVRIAAEEGMRITRSVAARKYLAAGIRAELQRRKGGK